VILSIELLTFLLLPALLSFACMGFQNQAFSEQGFRYSTGGAQFAAFFYHWDWEYGLWRRSETNDIPGAGGLARSFHFSFTKTRLFRGHATNCKIQSHR